MARRTETSDRRTFLKAVGGTGVAMTLAGCTGGGDGGGNGGGAADEDTTAAETTSSDSGGSGGNGDTLTVGMYGPFSGPASNIGQAMKKGAKLAAKEINANGGVDGATLELKFGDSESDPAKGRSAVEYMIDEQNVDVIGGGFHSDVSLAVIEVTNAKGVPQMISNSVSSAINDKIEEKGMQNVFKMSPPSAAYGLGWREFMNGLQEEEIGYFPYEEKRVAMIAEDTSYGLSVMDATKKDLEKGGWNVISTDKVAADESNFNSLLTRIRTKNPDVVWAVQTAPSAGANLIKQFRQSGFQNTHFLHTFVPSNPETISLAGDAANGVLWLSNIAVIPKFAKEIGLTDAWQGEYGEDVPGSSGSLPYDNLKLTRDAVAALGGVGELSVESWEQAVIDLEPTKGSVGTFDFQEDHQAKWGVDSVPPVGFQITDQKSHVVWPFEAATKEIDESLYK